MYIVDFRFSKKNFNPEDDLYWFIDNGLITEEELEYAMEDYKKLPNYITVDDIIRFCRILDIDPQFEEVYYQSEGKNKGYFVIDFKKFAVYVTEGIDFGFHY